MPTATIGQGSAVHVAYLVGGNVTGSLCNPYAWETSRVRASDRDATCPRCARATVRAAEQTVRLDPDDLAPPDLFDHI